ncbi:DUF4276 family protein [Hymenobacter psychrotolerans]|uniref:DUF4276 domain-containing protein n=1 Tax=Hymenobacter psychrotolerans DSM 18569 TaxID=1121959 RepID=A0A1M6SN99_9BACT|nr:DUF4276 family protein [Hymenobacter psychrotolerans]SHK46099.1 protein of unknown function [Hymenobacter psychrotolerans DSM 18569]
MSKIKCIGIIAEDDSDFECSKIIIKRIINKNIPFKKAIGNGCGKMKRKAAAYAVDLKKRGCDMLILIHDLDRNNLTDLRIELEKKLEKSPICTQLICIPIEEIEGWFLSDPDGIAEIFNLKTKPKIKGSPESVTSPKETLEKMVRLQSENNTIYLNTKHNKVLAEKLSIDLMKSKCQSFEQLHKFVAGQKY